MDHHSFLLGFFGQSSKYQMVEFLLFLLLKADLLCCWYKNKVPWLTGEYQSHSNPGHKSYCCIGDDLFRTQILHYSSNFNIFYMIWKYFLFSVFTNFLKLRRGNLIFEEHLNYLVTLSVFPF